MQTLKRNLPIALVTLPFHLYAWYASCHLSFNTYPLGRMELNTLCCDVVSIVLILFLILTLGVLLVPTRLLAICLATAIVVSHFVVSGNILRIRNTASRYIEGASGAPNQK